MKIKLNLLDLPEFYFGAEDEETDPNANAGDAGNDSGDANGDANDGSNGSEEHDDANDPKVTGLKSSLAAARAEAKAAQKKANALQRAEDERILATKSEVEQANAKAETATEKLNKLTAGFLNTRLNAAIEKTAEKLNFLDTDDALKGVDRSKLVYEQDEDDPSEVTIDLKSIEREVKALSARKPHFVKSGTDDGEPTGGAFGGSTKSKEKPSKVEELKALYPGQFE